MQIETDAIRQHEVDNAISGIDLPCLPDVGHKDHTDHTDHLFDDLGHDLSERRVCSVTATDELYQNCR